MITINPNHHELKKQASRRLILDAAREIIVRDGYDGFSMRKLATSVGYSPGNLYVHFENKLELFTTLVDESFKRLHEILEKIKNTPGTTDSVTLLKQGMHAYVAFGLDNPSDYRIAFMVTASKAQGPYVVHPAFEVLREMVARCKKEHRFAAVQAELASQSLWVAIHGVTSLLIQRPTFPWVRQKTLIRQVIDNAVDGLVKPATATHRGATRHE